MTSGLMQKLHYIAAAISMLAAFIMAACHDSLAWILFGFLVAFMNIAMGELLSEKE